MKQTLHALVLAERLAVQFEGIYLKPYLCPAGKPTIGIGATFYETGRVVTLLDKPITRDRAFELLRWHLVNSFLPKVTSLCPGIRTPEQLAAILDFTFNLGVGNLRASTLRKKINQGRWDEVPAQLRRWNLAGGVVQRGLVRRREAEIALLS